MSLSFNGKEVNKICFNNNVGYTVVGNPTIVDGVVSESSSGNYVKPTSNVPFSRASSWEFVSRFQVEANTTGSHFLADFAVEAKGFDISVTSTSLFWELGKAGASNWQYSKTISYTFDPTIFYSVKLSFDGNLYSIWLKTDTTQWTKLDEYASTTGVGTSYYNAFGYSIRFKGRVFNGSIDLNETYIKVNGITWFSGKQQASTDVNYVIKDGKLIWANPNLYLRAPARSSADQGFGTPIINTGVTITDYTYGLDLRYRAYQGPMEGMLMLGNINSYRYQTDKISLFGTTNNFSKRTDSSACRMVYDGPANTASLYWGDGTSETLDITSGTSFNSGPQKLGSGWNYNTGFDYYYYKLFKSGAVIHHFVPVPAGLQIGDYTVPSNGMWDIVTQQFFGNSGTGEFSYGKDN